MGQICRDKDGQNQRFSGMNILCVFFLYYFSIWLPVFPSTHALSGKVYWWKTLVFQKLFALKNYCKAPWVTLEICSWSQRERKRAEKEEPPKKSDHSYVWTCIPPRAHGRISAWCSPGVVRGRMCSKKVWDLPYCLPFSTAVIFQILFTHQSEGILFCSDRLQVGNFSFLSYYCFFRNIFGWE